MTDMNTENNLDRPPSPNAAVRALSPAARLFFLSFDLRWYTLKASLDHRFESRTGIS
jgi:hypothetical protein